MYNTTIYSQSNSEIIQNLGRRFKRYRIRANMTQKEVAQHTGLSITTIHKFESGTLYNISLNALLQLLRSIDCLEIIETLLPNLPPSPYIDMRKGEIKQRVKHKTKQQ